LIFTGAIMAAIPATAATWHVAQDGSGDFTVIQAAIDAASPGDVIRIHAGRYEELITDYDVWGNNTVIADVHVAITKDDLTLEGDGADVTIIGPASYPSDPTPNYIGITVTSTQATTLTIRNLAVENTRYGMYIACPNCYVTSCRFEGNSPDGIRNFASNECVISDCEVLDCSYGVTSFSPAANLSILNTRFAANGAVNCVCVGTDGVLVRDCEFVGAHVAVDFQQGTTGIIENVTASGFESTGVGLVMGGYAEIYDSTFEGGLRGVFSHGLGVHCERVTFSNQTLETISQNSDGESFYTDCRFINGGGLTVKCYYNGSQDCHVDMTNCYWGTDSEDQIAEWIWDSNDDPGRCCTVDFIPFQGTVATESRSWSAVKEMFGPG
jgi:hypothetical protein